MNAEQINAKIYAGRGKVALRLGFTYDVWRPVIGSDPFTNQIATIKAAFNAGDNRYKSPNMPGDAFWYGDFDGRVTQAGDYLVNQNNPLDIKYIAAQQPLLPIICVDCNRKVRLTRAAPQWADGTVGAVGYSGVCDMPAESSDVIGTNPASNGGVFVGWPCAILFGGKSQAAIGLPGDVKNSGWRILLPPSVPVVLRAGDSVTDDLGKRYAIEGAEQSDIGWRINAMEVHP